MTKRWIFIGPADRPRGCYDTFEYGKVYEESENGNILGHVGPRHNHTQEQYKAMWRPADFQVYLTELESGSI